MRTIFVWLRVFGLDLRRFIQAVRSLKWYLISRKDFRNQQSADFDWGTAFPILDERTASSGELGAYFFQDTLVARWIFEANPEYHYDVGSRLDGFIGMLSIFRKVEVFDIRPQGRVVKNINFSQLDILDSLPDGLVEITDSLSCLHTIEHFGLGRYGDAINTEGHLKGLEALKRIVKPGGIIYLSTPIGKQRIEFNAHRIFSMATVLS